MKFARHLEEEAVDEWRKAYINYRALKKVIKQIAQHQEQLRQHPLASQPDGLTPSSSLLHRSVSFGRLLRPSTPARPPRAESQPVAEARQTQADVLQDKRAASVDLEAPKPGHLHDLHLSRPCAHGPVVDGYGSIARSNPLAVPPHPDAEQRERGRERGHDQLSSLPDPLSAASPSSPTDPSSRLRPSTSPEPTSLSPRTPLPTRRSSTAPGDSSQRPPVRPFMGAAAGPSPASSPSRHMTWSERLGAGAGTEMGPEWHPVSGGAAATLVEPQAKSQMKRPSSKSSLAQRFFPAPLTLEDLLSRLDEDECQFFVALDKELEKIFVFYEEREAEAVERFEVLSRQLRQLSAHRKEFKALQTAAEQTSSTADLLHTLLHRPASLLHGKGKARAMAKADASLPSNGDANRKMPRPSSAAVVVVRTSLSSTAASRRAPAPLADKSRTSLGLERDQGAGAEARSSSVDGIAVHSQETFPRPRAATNASRQGRRDDDNDDDDDDVDVADVVLDPEQYRQARRKLKAALFEFYRTLQILKNYRILNRTGFLKILKKFEKTCEIPCSVLYYSERVNQANFVVSDKVDALMRRVEDVFTAYFAHGDRKKAIGRLRLQEGPTSHYFSVWRSGMFLGLGLPALVAGLIESQRHEKQLQIPEWQGLLHLYGAFFIPVVFSLLFGVNLIAWHWARINWPFIFEFDPRTQIDYRRYFELPSLLFFLLSYAFWLTFADPWPAAISPTSWPLVWLVVTIVLICNPLPIMHIKSRIWFVRSLLRVFTGGLLYRIEFRDFFLGDELNSLSYTFPNLYLLGCGYKHHWHNPLQRCNTSTHWGAACLAALPAFLRFLQCFRRFKDSNYAAKLHLVNAGKYASSIINTFLSLNYRAKGSSSKEDLAVWIVFGVIYSLYTSAWDIMMDWSLLKPHAKFPLLRDELAFGEYPWVYYFAMVSDVTLRFGWVWYLPPGAPPPIKSFIIALLEMLRRWQWNFFRVENEHLGNVDMYRVSKDVPLPYTLPQRSADDETDRQSKRSRKTGHMSDSSIEAREGVTANRYQGASRRASGLVRAVRNVLLPNGDGATPLEDRGAARGTIGRDYTPQRPMRVAAGLSDESDMDDAGSVASSEGGRRQAKNRFAAIREVDTQAEEDEEGSAGEEVGGGSGEGSSGGSRTIRMDN